MRLTIEEAMAELRETARAIERPRTLASYNAERIEALETEMEFLKREVLQAWEAILVLAPPPVPV